MIAGRWLALLAMLGCSVSVGPAPQDYCGRVAEVGACIGKSFARCAVRFSDDKRATVDVLPMVGDRLCGGPYSWSRR